LSSEDIGLVVPITADAAGFNSAIAGIQSSTKTSMDGVKTAVIGAFAAVGAAVAGVAIAGVAMSDNLKGSMNQLQTETGASDQAMAGLKDSVEAIYNNNYGADFADIAASMASVGKATGITGKELEGLSQTALMMRDSFGMEVGDSIKSVDKMMKSFGVTGTEAYNLIAQGAQNGLDKNGDLLDTLNEYSGTFAAQGFSATEMFNMISNATKAGVKDTDLAADAIKEFGIRSKDGSKTSADGFAALGLSATAMTKDFATGGDKSKAAFEKTTKALLAMKDPVAQNAAGIALFGTQFEDMGIKGVRALLNTKGEINQTKDALGKIGELNGATLGATVEGIRRTLVTGLLVPIGDELIPKFQDFGKELKDELPGAMATVKPIVMGIIDVFALLVNNLNLVIPLIAGVVAGFAAYKVVAIATGIMEAYKKSQEGLTVVQWALNAAMDANPIGGIVLLVTALVAAGVLLWMNWDKVKAKCIEVFGAISTKINEVMSSVSLVISETWTSITTFLSSVWDGITSTVSAAWNGIKQIFTNVVDAIVQFVTTKFSKQIQDITVIFNDLKRIFIAVWEIYKNIFLGAILLIIDLVTGNFTKLKSDAMNIFDNLKTYIGDIWDNLVSIFSHALSIITTTLSGAWSSIKATIISVWNGILAWLRQLPSQLSTIGSNMFTSMKNGVTGTISGVKSAITSGINSAMDWLSGMPGKMRGYGIDMIQGLIGGIKAMIGKIGDAVTGVADKIRSILHFSVPDEGPLTDYESWMPDFMGGLARGIADNKNKVTEAVKGLAMDMSLMPALKTNVKLTGGYAGDVKSKSNQDITKKKDSSGGLSVLVDKFINNRAQDVQGFAEELEFFRRQTSAARGGV